MRILIADDHPVFRFGLRALLESQPDMEVAGEVESVYAKKVSTSSPEAGVDHGLVVDDDVGGARHAQGLLDLEYREDSTAEVDFNVIGTDAGTYVELQGTAEGKPFDRAGMDALLALADNGLQQLFKIQDTVLAGESAEQ